MKTIHLKADGTSLSVDRNDTNDLVKGCHGFYELSFALSNDYVGFAIACEFTTKNKITYEPVKASKCKVPDDAADSSNYKVRLIAEHGIYQIKTNRVLIEQGGGANA